MIQRIQPIITDAGYRQSSEEQIFLAEGKMMQRHQGPDGVKTVARDPKGTTVVYFPRGRGQHRGTSSQRSRDGFFRLGDRCL